MRIKEYFSRLWAKIYKSKQVVKVSYYCKKIFKRKQIGEMESIPVSVINDKNIEKVANIQKKVVVNGHVCSHINLDDEYFAKIKDPIAPLKTISIITVPVRHKKSRRVVMFRGSIEDLKAKFNDDYEVVESAIKE